MTKAACFAFLQINGYVVRLMLGTILQGAIEQSSETPGRKSVVAIPGLAPALPDASAHGGRLLPEI